MRTFLRGLAALQCRLLGGEVGAIYFSGGSGGETRLFAYSIPEDAKNQQDLIAALTNGQAASRLTRLASEVAGAPLNAADATGKSEPVQLGASGALYTGESTHRALATPLVAEGESRGACVVLVPRSDPAPDAEKLRTLTLTVARFEAYIWRQQFASETEQKLMLRETLQLLDVAQQGLSSRDMSSMVCHELQRRFGCSRVSIGIINRDRLEVIAVSGSDHIDRRTGVVNALEGVMEECAAQDTEIIFPLPAEHEQTPAERRIVREHEALSDSYGPCGILSLPLRLEGDLVGVAVLEREPHDPFPAAAIPLVRLVAEFIGPSVWLRRLADRGVLAVTRDRALELGEAIVGPRHTVAKLVTAILAAVVILSLIMPIPGRIKSSMEITPLSKRTLVPTFAGRLDEVFVDAGDPVSEGQPIARMATADLELQLAEARANAETIRSQLDSARASGELADVRVGETSLMETEARIDLIADRIAAATIRSPIEGIVGRGELDPLVGSQVDSTRALLEVVSADVRVRLEVPEHAVHRVDVGDEGWFRVRSISGKRVKFVVSRITPTAQVVRGANVFVVECEIDASDESLNWLRAGMTGSARIKDGWTTPAIAILGPVVDSLRLRLWW